MLTFSSSAFKQYTQETVARALSEDLGTGDCTADLIPSDKLLKAQILTRENMILAGKPFVESVFQSLDETSTLVWHVEEGQAISANTILCTLSGKARALLSGERTALNFLQTLSGTATATHFLKSKIADLPTQLLDTRKTLPGLRLAQKYAVWCGGGTNHRIGLFDAVLLKENHLACFTSISAAIQAAKANFPGLKIEVEVENLDQLEEALLAEASHILLDNFSLPQLEAAVARTGDRAQLEASGNIDEHTLRSVALTGVHAISTGSITKHVRAIDLSMRFLE